MEIYLYCNYTNSRLGFQLTRLTAGGLEPVSLHCCQDKAEQAVDRFFSFDRFRILWREIQLDDKKIFAPEPFMGLFGIRGIHGEISGREGIVNIAFLFSAEEFQSFEALGRAILSQLRPFCEGIFQFLTVGGTNGYELDAVGFMSFIEQFEAVTDSEPPFFINSSLSTSKDLLRFGVYLGSPDEALSDFGSPWMWMIKPKQLISDEKFREIVGNLLY